MKKITALLVCVLFYTQGFCCTGISLTTKDNKYIQARTIEWGGYNLNSKLIVMPRGVAAQANTPDGKNGLKWKGKYGYVGISLIQDDLIGEGLNEKGLNAGLFYFPGFGSLSNYEKRKARKSLSDMDLVRWMLSNFSTVEEVEKGLKHVVVVPVGYDENGQPLPTAHWRVSDATGRNIVLEITDGGRINIYENKVGVITNSPQYPWHLENLRNYVNLRPGGAKPFDLNGVEISAFGAGSGFLGLPGDVTPPSRFIRAAAYVASTPAPLNAVAAVLQSFTILNNFDIPLAIEFEKGATLPDFPSATQWTSVSNLSDRVFYYKTMYNNHIRRIKIDALTLDLKSPKAMPLDKTTEYPFEDVVF